MIFLPVVERELRVAARKRSTFWSRIAATIVALLIAIGFLMTVSIGGPAMSSVAMGKVLFGVLSWLSLAAAVFAGCFLTSDCLSEEKREGTIGFLFLTDLRGYDVVLGKLLATSLRGFFTFLAVFPVMAITLLMGGVTGAELWRTSAALVVVLLLSLAAGMFVSSASRDPQRAMGATLLLLIALSAVGPALDELVSGNLMRLTSPVFLFLSASWPGSAPFWKALVVNMAIAGLLLAASALLLPRAWQVNVARPSAAAGSWSRRLRLGGTVRQVQLRERLASIDPVLWLACRDRWQTSAVWGLALLSAALLITCLVLNEAPFWFAWSYLFGAFSLLLYLLVASQSNRFFVDAQRSGLTELLLATPLTVGNIVRGQWRALIRMFAMPVALCLFIQFVGTTIAQQQTNKAFGAIAARPAPGGTNVTALATNSSGAVIVTTALPFALGTAELNALVPYISAVMVSVATLANLVALAWFGMWMGLTSKTNHMATLKTFALVQVAPWFVIAFASSMATGLIMYQGFRGTPTFSWTWYQFIPTAVSTVLCVAKDAAFVVWARRKLFTEFRARATGTALPKTRKSSSSGVDNLDEPPVIA